MITYTISRQAGYLLLTKQAGQSSSSMLLPEDEANPIWIDLTQMALAAKRSGKAKYTFLHDGKFFTFEGNAVEADAFARRFKAALDGKKGEGK